MKSNTVKIWGIVNSAGGGKSQGEKYWTLIVSLIAWRLKDGLIQNTPLRLEVPRLSESRMNRLMAKVKEMSVLSAEVVITATSNLGIVGIVSKIQPLCKNQPDLNKHAKLLKKPVEVQHPYFGKLLLDRRRNEWVVQWEWKHHRIELCVTFSDVVSELEMMDRAVAVCRDFERLHNQATSMIVTKNPLDCYYDEDNNRHELTREKYLDHLKAPFMLSLSSANFYLYYSGGDILGEHAFTVEADYKKGIVDAWIE